MYSNLQTTLTEVNMYIDVNTVLERISPQDRVLDLGGWDRVFPRANVVVDLLPYETRRVVHPEIAEAFTRESWVQADFCNPRFWKTIPDKAFDFIIISHTLEDIRDPLFVCEQMIRCGKAGYIETPSKMRECARDSESSPCAGYAHHRWIIEPMADKTGLIFKAKLSWAHQHDYLGHERRWVLQSFFHQLNGYFWQGSFNYIEHFPKGIRRETRDLHHFYANADYRPHPEFLIELTPDSISPLNGTCLWVDQYLLPTEIEDQAAERLQETTT